MVLRVLEVQRTIDVGSIPNDNEFQLWLESALSDYSEDAEVLIRIVDFEEISTLNWQYRHRKGPTNILSFPLEMPEFVKDVSLLGDLVVCAPVVEQEAVFQHKSLTHHWAHIIIHGILHLLGYDHIEESDALEMEAKEIAILKRLNINNPYLENEVNG